MGWPSSTAASRFLLRHNGVALWLWFETSIVAAALAAVVAVLVIVTQPGTPAASLCGLIVCVFALTTAWLAHFAKGRSGWVEVEDDGWAALRDETNVEEPRDAAATIATIRELRRQSFARYASTNAAFSGCATTTVLGACAAIALFAMRGESAGAAAFALLLISSSTLPLFGNLHVAQNEHPSFFHLVALATASPLWLVAALIAACASVFASCFSSVADSLTRSKLCACRPTPRRREKETHLPEEDLRSPPRLASPGGGNPPVAAGPAPRRSPDEVLVDFETVGYLPEGMAEGMEGLDDDDSSDGTDSPGQLAHLPSI
mmetsp:Transcript_7870/g.24145  ORF Transcript_7870/g.24145 Transcript_7870/m.24145 type:complete len:318 (+) Transcript_7870:49-1002(+)